MLVYQRVGFGELSQYIRIRSYFRLVNYYNLPRWMGWTGWTGWGLLFRSCWQMMTMRTCITCHWRPPLATSHCPRQGGRQQWKTWGTRPIDGPILPHTLPIKVGIFWLAMLYKLPESVRVYVFFRVVGCDMGRRRFVGLWACSVQHIGLVNSWKCARQTCQSMRILQSSFCRPYPTCIPDMITSLAAGDVEVPTQFLLVWDL